MAIDLEDLSNAIPVIHTGPDKLAGAKVDANGSTRTVITNATDGSLTASITGYNRLRVNTEGSCLLVDHFDVADTNRWTSANSGTGAVTYVNGAVSFTTGTTANNQASLTSVPTFEQQGNVYLEFGINIKVEAAPIANVYRFWGLATSPGGGSTYANPIQDGIGFELDGSGVFRAVMYSAGVRTYAQVITLSNDGNLHRYAFFYNTQFQYFYGQSLDIPIASNSTGLPLTTQILPLKILMINGATPPISSPTFSCSAIAITDTGRNNTAISDGKYGFRKATVAPNGGIAVTPLDSYKASYSASIGGLTSALLCTDLFSIVGSASKTVRVTRIAISGTQTNQNIIDVLLIKRSTDNSGGVFSTLTAVSHDSANSAASATVRAYTTNPTVGTTVGALRADKLFNPATTPSGSAGIGSVAVLLMDFGVRPSQAIVLRGTSEVLSLNLNGQSAVGSSFDIYIEWTEE